MKVQLLEREKYKKFQTRYDLNYWKEDREQWLKISSFEFENDIMLVVEKLKEHKIESLSINTFGNNYQINFENFKYLTFVKELSIDSGSYINVKYLYLLENLESLWINNENYGEEIDLTRFKSLKKLIISNSCRKLKGVFSLSNLMTLKLQKFNEENLSKFTNMNNLTALELVQSKINSLKGIEKMSNLRCLTLFYSPGLYSIEDIANLKELEYLELHNCKKIQKYEMLKSNINLNRLVFDNCSPIDNLNFLRNLKKLKFIGLVETNVVDGDITPLIEIPEHGYTNKKNFNYYMNSKGIDIKR